MKYYNLEKAFVKFSTFTFALLPIILALLIFFMSPSNIIFSFFILLLEMSLILGVIVDISDHHMHMVVTVIGFLISSIEAYVFGNRYGFHNGVVGFLIYQWVWQTMYEAGLDISVNDVDYMKLFTTLTITFGSMGAIIWFWFSHIF